MDRIVEKIMGSSTKCEGEVVERGENWDSKPHGEEPRPRRACCGCTANTTTTWLDANHTCSYFELWILLDLKICLPRSAQSSTRLKLPFLVNLLSSCQLLAAIRQWQYTSPGRCRPINLSATDFPSFGDSRPLGSLTCCSHELEISRVNQLRNRRLEMHLDELLFSCIVAFAEISNSEMLINF